MKKVLGYILFRVGWIAMIGGLLWMIWLPVLGDFHDFFLPLAIGWTGCIVGAIGVVLDEGK